ncbi:MAG: dTDP-4-dehydrorhamnose reductase [Geodermatophilaceae bacterium]|nr:dTDP-4-dehydrorhamnose reductase [Geodermatophilaceae bacterium]
MTHSVTGWLVTGAAGTLGRELSEVLAADGSTGVVLADRARLDVTDADAVRQAVSALGTGGVVLNAAGWTNVDAAEAHENEARAINGTAVQVLASACRDAGAALIHVSTDYVFGASASDETWPENGEAYAEDSPTSPINAYGRTKLAGETAVLATCPDDGYVLRTGWLYGRYGRNFVSTMLDLAATDKSVDVVDDQVGQPTWACELARRMVDIGLQRPAPGIYHATAAGETSWYGLARAAYAEAGLNPDRVRPVTTAAFPRPAPRPTRSVLSHGRWRAAGLPPLDHWKPMLERALRTGGLQSLHQLPGLAAE